MESQEFDRNMDNERDKAGTTVILHVQIWFQGIFCCSFSKHIYLERSTSEKKFVYEYGKNEVTVI